jgi:UPF0755 protein
LASSEAWAEHVAEEALARRLVLSAGEACRVKTYGCTVAPAFLGAASPACQKWDGRIRRIHLDDPANPYNTYTHEGLPPGPIANPGRAALLAVLRPDGTNYLYFVAKNDGTHQFSATVAEHEAAVTKYQRGGKALP